ncbi:protein-export chaperone SecB [Clostridium perfringens]|uniref:protein-export chaperone SecB n=1 Tax=Clostridium perfringens TaxID=1502 RepID=UPI000D715A27|nr:protein-export chaperone SecB [Clostridium perfringens]MDM0489975.1 protein-export chaperone SecB [Clostridium perfringens]MDM0672646.1 protein-export chaperone SecB [Clostridium perfringens]PWX52269.1 protein export chaperone secb [Clostridium perfringens]
MKKSVLKFNNPILKELKYKINNEFSSNDNISLDIKLETKISKSEENAIVEVTLLIFDKEVASEVPFKMKIVMYGEFSWDENSDKELISKLLETNAPAIIISYIRPYVSSMTVGSGFAPLILPVLDLSHNKVNYD